jgi:hypothetical protein
LYFRLLTPVVVGPKSSSCYVIDYVPTIREQHDCAHPEGCA